jgi:hypothetical protein
LEKPGLMSTLCPKVAPPSLLTAANTWTLTALASLRVSYQLTPTSPVLWSTSMLGQNWLGPGVVALLPGGGASGLTARGADQLMPLVSE